jgi:hypothetical protein
MATTIPAQMGSSTSDSRSTLPPGRLWWAHSDTVGDLASVADQARTVARSGTWIEGEEGERLFRALLVDWLAAVSALGPTPMAEVVDGDPALAAIAPALQLGRRFLVELRPSARADEYDFQNAIVVAIAALASDRGMKKPADVTIPAGVAQIIVTRDADPPTVISGTKAGQPANAGVLPGVIGAVVVVSCVGLIAGAVGWITSQYFEATAIGLTADAKAKQAATAIQAAVDVVEKHQAAQVSQGKTNAYDAGELAVLESLRSSIKELSGWEPPALKSAPNLSAATSAVGASLSLGTAIILLVVAWLVFSKGSSRA